MNYSFEYIDIILLAMIAGFIFLRLRGILGKRSGFEGKTAPQFQEIIKNIQTETKINQNDKFDEDAQKEFLKGAKIAYETIITDFSDNDNKITTSRQLLNGQIYSQFNDALKERSSRGHFAEITFIGINSAEIKEHKKIGNILNVTVDFIAEVITCIRDKDKKIVSGDPEKIKKIYDTWVFSRDTTSVNPNWQLVNTLTQLTRDISEKDKKDWENFLQSSEKIHNKDNVSKKLAKPKINRIDLHGYSLAKANEIIENFIEKNYEQGINKLIVVTGKGIHSSNEKDPYISKDLSILKYSVPEFIKNNKELMKIIIDIKEADIKDGGSGAFYIYLKKK